MAESKSGKTMIIPVSDWQKITESFGENGVPMPFVQEIFLIKCTVAGTTHVENIKRKTSDLGPGSLLAFRREPDNPFDDMAILILNSNNEKIGYIPREKNEILARLMDGGKLLFGRIEEKHEQRKWIRITAKVFMRDL